ncbi:MULTISPECIES: tetratricopeptide repeat protein [Amycolatopsis]|uniref:Tetratricopeptide repeat-containing protein n=2 Tax=Amycolatopsis TaxID=1813 RepID=A0A1I3ZBM0_9PSEU|nr:tetratricopeptide repeat protein [Amycolatopsis sacchari]SFK40979.1 Tetratricopeptide repeat-containing protein [Amycolatopsis sacchari]
MSEIESGRLAQLVELLTQASVRVHREGSLRGSGFFVAPGTVLTCAHVTDGVSGAVEVEWGGRRFAADVVHAEPAVVNANPCPPPDLAVLRLSDAEAVDHPCVVLDDEPLRTTDRVLACGVAPAFGHALESETFDVTGQKWFSGGDIVKLGRGQAVPGMSGSPVLSLRTGRVGGMLRTTRDATSALGAWVVPAARLRQTLAELALETVERMDWTRVAEGWDEVVRDAFVPRPVLPEDAPPSLLLKSEYEFVPFLGRNDLIERIETWQRQRGHLGVALLTGRGGEGKTRLARQLCARAATRPGTIAGLLHKDVPAEVVDRLAALSGTVLLVVDYADTREDELVRLLDTLARNGERTNVVRVLLLARSTGDWLERLQARSPDRVALMLESAPVWALPPLAEAAPLHAEALRRFAERFGTAVREEFAPPADGHALTVCLTALTQVLDEAVPTAATEDSGPSARLLHHEARYWLDAAHAEQLPDTHPELLRTLVCAATLLGADDPAEAEHVVAAVPESPAGYEWRYLQWLRGLYPAEAGVAPLEPDRLGEDLLARCLRRRPDLLQILLTGATEAQSDRAWTVAARAAARHPAVAEALSAAVRADARRWLGPAVSGAISAGEPAVAAPLIEAGTPLIPDPLVLTEVEQRIPATSLALAGAALTLAETAVVLSAELPPTDRALLLSRCATRLSDARRYPEARRHTEQALAIRRELAAADPAAEPLLAQSVHQMAIRLARAGEHEDAGAYAREAVEIRRRLAEAGTEDSRRELAASLNNLSVRLAELGEDEEALAAIEEAVALKRGLYREDSDTSQASLAVSLNNLAVRLSRLGRESEARDVVGEAVELRRLLAERSPDSYLPALALSLNNLAARLANSDPEAAWKTIQEAVHIRERLAYLMPDRYRSSLAVSLNSLAARLGALGYHEEALPHVDRAIALKRELPPTVPANRESLATSLLQRASRLQDLGRLAEALDSAREAVAIRRELPDTPRYRKALARAEERCAFLVNALNGGQP